MEEEIANIANVRVDRDLCLTAATCLAWNIYDLDDESKAVLLTNNGSTSDEPDNPLVKDGDGTVSVESLLNTDSVSIEEMRRRVYESAQSCPFNAIIVTDKDGNQIWPKE